MRTIDPAFDEDTFRTLAERWLADHSNPNLFPSDHKLVDDITQTMDVPDDFFRFCKIVCESPNNGEALDALTVGPVLEFLWRKSTKLEDIKLARVSYPMDCDLMLGAELDEAVSVEIAHFLGNSKHV